MNGRSDFREALRALRRQSAFTIAAIVTFALALGTTTAIFAALHAVILTPLPFAEPSRLVIAWRQEPAAARAVVEVSHHQFREWQTRARGFAQLAAMLSVTSRPSWRMPSGERRKIAAAPVSHEFFSVLGVSPMLGRVFLPGGGSRQRRRHGRARRNLLAARVRRRSRDRRTHARSSTIVPSPSSA